jgi:hypothetical protein
MGKHSRRSVWSTILTVLIGTGCGGSSPFEPSDPSQATRGIAAGPVEGSSLSSAVIERKSGKGGQACSRSAAIDRAALDDLVETWPAQPKAAVKAMADKYGMPLEATSESVVWHDAGSYKRITVTKSEVAHDSPRPHMDFVEHTIVLDVPTRKVQDLVSFETSMTVNKTAGELSARSDGEAHNARTLGLARDIIAGKKSVAEARKALGKKDVE